MSETSFIEKLAARRQQHVNSLLIVPDGDAIKHASIKGRVAGMDEAMEIFRGENKSDDEETHV